MTNMEQVFRFIIDSRIAFAGLLDDLSVAELNKIPEGFNNNIIWNFGHIVVSTPILCYVRTGIWADSSSIPFVEAYQKGTKPTYAVSTAEVNELRELAVSTIQLLEKDFHKGLFQEIQPFNTATFGTTIDNFTELLATTIGHDNVHYGYAIAQKRIIKNSK